MTLTNRWAVLALVFFSRTSMAIQFFSIPPLLTVFVAEWGISYAQSGLLISIAMFAGILLALVSGLLGQRFGDKTVFAVGLALQASGAALLSQADGFALALSARALTGVGVVFLNVLATKIVTDWFAGRELATGMAVMVSSWPFGAAVGLLGKAPLAEWLGWRGAIGTIAALSALFCLAFLLLYRNPQSVVPAGAARLPVWSISRLEMILVVLAALVWSLPNAGFVIFNGFTPTYLEGRGMEPAVVGLVVSFISWISIPCALAGGWITDRTGRINSMIVLGVVACGLFMVGMAQGTLLWTGAVGIGLALGAWPGAVMSLPGQVLSPSARATGFGIFYTVFYLFATSMPPLAGWLRDQTGSGATPLVFAAACFVAGVVPLALLRLAQQRLSPVPAPQEG